MKVFKFGGASVKDASSVRNVAEMINLYPSDHLMIVVSAMGKTTDALERYTSHCFINEPEAALEELKAIRAMHEAIMDGLFATKEDPVYADTGRIFAGLEKYLAKDKILPYDTLYDLIVHTGEMLSTRIISHYLNRTGVPNTWFDAREMIQTDNTHREGKVDWKLTTFLVSKILNPLFQGPERHIGITQGFVAGTTDNATTTLGREGSDFTAAILAFCLDAEEVTIWKDVPGVLNADPKYFPDTIRLPAISYKEAIELSYYGASVIHPKTLKPLQNKQIPLKVKSFIDPQGSGTLISEKTDYDTLVPSYIFKANQILISIAPKDFSFINEKNLSHIIGRFADANIKLHLMQNSALNFSVCTDYQKERVDRLIRQLQENFIVRYNDHLQLITVRHYKEETIRMLLEGKELLLAQKGRLTARMVVRS